MLLFFKQIYRTPILSGEKTDTIRGPKRLPRVGSTVQACVGPSRIFAELLIESIEPVGQIDQNRANQVVSCYDCVPKDAVRIKFRLVSARNAPSGQACSAPAQSSVFD